MVEQRDTMALSDNDLSMGAENYGTIVTAI